VKLHVAVDREAALKIDQNPLFANNDKVATTSVRKAVRSFAAEMVVCAA